MGGHHPLPAAPSTLAALRPFISSFGKVRSLPSASGCSVQRCWSQAGGIIHCKSSSASKFQNFPNGAYGKPGAGVGWLEIPSGREIGAVQASGKKIHGIFHD